MNRNFGKNDEQGKWQFAPDRVTVNGVTYWGPQDEALYAQAEDGPWLPYRDEKPTDKLGVYYVPTETRELRDGVYYRVYEERPIVAPEPINRRWTRLKIKTALAMAGMIVKAEEYLSGVDIAPNYNAWQALGDCDYVEENWPQKETWNAVLDGAAAAFGKTREEIDAFLDSIPTEEVR